MAAEGLLDHDPPTFVEPDLGEGSSDERERRGRDRHVEHGVLGAVAVERLAEFVPGVHVAVVALDEIEASEQRLDDPGRRLRYGGQDAVVGVLAEPFVGPIAARHADHRHVEAAVAFEVIERREQLFLGQITRGSEQHEGVGFGLDGHRDASLRSTWPPNWARMADKTFIAIDARPRDSNRSNSDAESTGTGTPSSTAARTVHRPSPESLTLPENESSCGSSTNEVAVRSSSQLATTLPRRHTSEMAPRSKSYW
jgi:hypothetical protein